MDTSGEKQVFFRTSFFADKEICERLAVSLCSQEKLLRQRQYEQICLSACKRKFLKKV